MLDGWEVLYMTHKVEASIVNQVHLTTHQGTCNANMDAIYIFLGEWS